MPYMDNNFGNPGSLHVLGRSAKAAVDRAREQVAEFMGADSPEQIIFTSGGSEGNNMVMLGVDGYMFWASKQKILVSQIEHDSILNTEEHLPYGVEMVFAKPKQNGIVTAREVEWSMGKLHDIGLVSVMSANNELGTLNPVSEICEVAHRFGALFHTDAVQAAGLYPLEVSKNEYDYVTISSHKIHGPKGVGALYVRDRRDIHSLIWGGSHQEFGLRGGTENVAGIVGFGKACELMSTGYEERRKHLDDLNDTLFASLARNFHKHQIDPKLLHINGSSPWDAKTINLRFDGVDAQTLLLMLDSQGVCVSAGSACTAHEDTPSHVLKAIGLTDEEARSSIRISFSHMNTIAEVEQAAQIIADCVKALRS